MARGHRQARRRPASYREPERDVIPSRGPLAALTVPGAVGGCVLALETASLLGGRLPLADLLSTRSRHAREGYRGAAQPSLGSPPNSTDCRMRPVSRGVPTDGKPPKEGATLQQPALAEMIEQSGGPGSRISTVAMSGARSAPILCASAAR